MGNQSSKGKSIIKKNSEESNRSIINTNFKEIKQNGQFEMISLISTTKSEESNNEEILLKNSSNSNCNEEGNSDCFEKKIPLKITWDEGGEEVFISGDFLDWKEFYPMNKTTYTFEIDLVF